MDQSFGANIISISGEDGETFEVEVLDSVVYQNKEYFAVIPADIQSSDDLQVSILRQDDDAFLSTIDDDAELEAVYDLLLEQMYHES